MAQLSTTLPANEARANFYDMINEAYENLRTFVITHRGKPKAIVMPINELESWQETLDIISENPKILMDVGRAKKEIKDGKTMLLDDFIKKYDL